MNQENQANQSNQNSSGSGSPIPPKGPLDSNQAAELIRQQLSSIYTAQDGQPPANPAATQHFNPFQTVQQPHQESSPQQPPNNQPAHQPPAQEAQASVSPYFNPYHQQAAQQVPAPQQPPETAQAQGSNYRKNYSTYNIPGAKETSHTPPEQGAVPPVIGQQVPQAVRSESVSGSIPAERPSIADLKQNVIDRVQSSGKKKKHSKLKPLLVSLAIGFVFLAMNYNQIAIAQVKQYISPGQAISTPVILGPVDNEQVGPEPKIIIPKINVEAPLVYGITGFDEDIIQDGLQDGVVHYVNTARPGEKGNAVYLGHSSNNGFNRGEYKYVFVLLFRLELDDTFVIHHEGTRYVYKVTNKQVIEPTDFSLIQPTSTPTVTLITCTPPGTNWKRLVIQAQQISPDPAQASAAKNTDPIEADLVPSNSPSFLGEIWDSIF